MKRNGKESYNKKQIVQQDYMKREWSLEKKIIITKEIRHDKESKNDKWIYVMKVMIKMNKIWHNEVYVIFFHTGRRGFSCLEIIVQETEWIIITLHWNFITFHWTQITLKLHYI